MTFEEIKKEENIVLRFTADWCTPCKALAPIFDEVAKQNPETKTFVVDVDKFPELTQKFGVRGIPTIMKVKNGAVTLQMAGAQPRPEVEKFFK